MFEHRAGRGFRALLIGSGVLAAAAIAGALTWAFALGGISPRTAASTSHSVVAGQGAAVAGQGAAASAPAESTTTTAPPQPLRIVALRPASGATGVAGTGPVEVTFSSPVAASSSMPRLTPAVPGRWRRSGSALVFTPTGAFLPYSHETVTVPAGMVARDGGRLASGRVGHFSVRAGSTVRLQQLMSLLDYSPMAWTSHGPAIAPTDTAAQERAVFSPPAGTFSWRSHGWPATLTSQWAEGSYNTFTRGLVMAFQADHQLTMNGNPSTQLWATLLSALAHNQVNTGGYNYALASENIPESLTIWHNGRKVFSSPANTGIAVDPTAQGTFPVYERLPFQVMQGTNPDGSHYADPVQYVSYFNGGDAVHYIPRASYGYPQSLGCVELPLGAAAQAYPLLSYGTLVTVAG